MWSPSRFTPLALGGFLVFSIGCPTLDGGDSADATDTGSPSDTSTPSGHPITLVGFNVESGGSEPDAIADQVATVRGESLWGFSEVMNTNWANQLAAAAEDPDTPQDFDAIVGTTGNEDRLVIAYDRQIYTLESSWELHDINLGGTARAPLVAQLRHLASGRSLLFVLNHLWRTNDTYRHQQAGALNDWALEQDLPVVALGDYNFDWDVEEGESEHDVGYDQMIAGDVFRWVRPGLLVATQCTFNSVLDFVFLGGNAQQWSSESEILFPDRNYCVPSDETSDHRPVSATLWIP